MSRILVTGGTGALGRELVPRLAARGHEVHVLSRRASPELPPGVRAVRGDLTTGDGLAEATTGADLIVHCASGTGSPRTMLYRVARKTDVEATARLLGDAKLDGSPHVLYISIVGIDRIPLGYYRAKLECEHVIEASGLPFTILRTTQWHTLAWEFCRRLTRTPVAVVPRGVYMQLLDPSEVAERMVELAESRPRGHAPEMGGPLALSFREVVSTYLAAIGSRRPVASMPFPGRAMAGFRTRHNLAPAHAVGVTTWDDWLRRRLG